MARKEWPLLRGRPCVEVILTVAAGGRPLPRTLLADTGAGSRNSGFELILDENDCLLCGGNPLQAITLGGAFIGAFPTYLLPVQIPALGFARNLRAVGVPSIGAPFDGLACFGFLNRFHYGNFGNVGVFGLEF
jgi:hypothetical protein